ncbi:MAG: hypothetical protein EZS28_050908, partial [Streblomastix strix]
MGYAPPVTDYMGYIPPPPPLILDPAPLTPDQ